MAHTCAGTPVYFALRRSLCNVFVCIYRPGYLGSKRLARLFRRIPHSAPAFLVLPAALPVDLHHDGPVRYSAGQPQKRYPGGRCDCSHHQLAHLHGLVFHLRPQFAAASWGIDLCDLCHRSHNCLAVLVYSGIHSTHLYAPRFDHWGRQGRFVTGQNDQ
ncbi:hypothetical protein SDC9_128318 [bioreactor metagenome]|uniref:Uncharacterized protein n=1 Tax=bioreactor metagenome TaxID=1076179 RepID=A0A645CVV8_9ZZZZ